MNSLPRKIELIGNLLQRDALIAKFEDLSVTSGIRCRSGRKRSPLPSGQTREDRDAAIGQTAPAVPLSRVTDPCTQRDFLPRQGLHMSCRHSSMPFTGSELIESFQIVLEL